MENTPQKRLVAYKIDVNSINESEFVKEEGWTPNHIDVGLKKVSRLNVMATVVNKEEQRFSIDDGTGTINVVSFEPMIIIEELKVGDAINIIGKPREYNGEKYIMPEIIKVIDKEWLKVRAHELKNNKVVVEEKKVEEKVETVEIVDSSPGDVVLETIGHLDKGDGVTFDEINEKIKIKDVEQIITQLLERGEIFEIRPGRYKLLE